MNYTPNHLESISSNIEELQKAVVLQAVEDLETALKKRNKLEEEVKTAKQNYYKSRHKLNMAERKQNNNERLITECKKFFTSDRIKIFTDIDGQKILDEIERRVEQ